MRETSRIIYTTGRLSVHELRKVWTVRLDYTLLATIHTKAEDAIEFASKIESRYKHK